MALSPYDIDIIDYVNAKADAIEIKIDEILNKGRNIMSCSDIGRDILDKNIFNEVRCRYLRAGWADVKLKYYGKHGVDLIFHQTKSWFLW